MSGKYQYPNMSKQCTFIISCAEDVDFLSLNKKFDFIFTSPPYFNIERYTQEANQSFNRYRKLNNWLENFLFVSIKKSFEVLTDDGVMAINISDVYSGHKVNQICEPMNNFFKNELKANYVGCIGYRMQKKLGTKSNKQGIFCEPIWLWSKNNKTLIDYLKSAALFITNQAWNLNIINNTIDESPAYEDGDIGS